MAIAIPEKGLKLISTLSSAGELKLELADIPISQPGPDEVLIRVEASPINPSDILVMIPGVDLTKADFAGSLTRPTLTATLPVEVARSFSTRFEQPIAVGLEGAGTVIATGEQAQHLIGKRVAALLPALGMYGQYCTVKMTECALLPENITAVEGAGVFCNPLTALAIVETLHQEGHTALVHTAAASNLGQMLVKICLEDDIPLVNIVRREEHVDLLKGLGAEYVCNSSSPTFEDELLAALKTTEATVAFDAIGGSTPSQLLALMEKSAVSRMPIYSPYGSSESKQVYVYGRLDKSPISLGNAAYGMTWNVGGWAMPPILAKAGTKRSAELLQRIVNNLKTTFASQYYKVISLAEALHRDNIFVYSQMSTGRKFLINPQR